MRPTNPKTYKLTYDNRVTVGEAFLPDWAARKSGAVPAYCVPLIWARRIELPVGHELEAWYVWSEQEATTEWRVSPRALIEGSQPSPQAAVIYDASIEESDRKYRISCPGLFTSLKDLGHRFVWLTSEPPSFALWTDYAYQAWHGKLL